MSQDTLDLGVGVKMIGGAGLRNQANLFALSHQ